MTTFDEWNYGYIRKDEACTDDMKEAFNAAKAIDKQRIAELEQELATSEYLRDGAVEMLRKAREEITRLKTNKS